MSALVACCAGLACYSVPDPVQWPDAGGDAHDAGGGGGRDGAMSSPEAGREASAPDGGPSCSVFESCNNNLDCAEDCTLRVCAVDPTVPPTLLTAAGGPFCTQACCTSSDCPAGTVCFASGEGGQYCVDPSWVGRAKPNATALGGAPCAQNGDCRSGLCTGGTCQDTCCSAVSAAAECAAPMTCVFGNFPGAIAADKHFGAHCGPQMGGGGEDATCMTGADCVTGFCYQGNTNQCMNPCRNAGDCGNPSDVCGYDFQGSDLYAHCYPPPTGTMPMGAMCNVNASTPQCQGYYCATYGCTGVCFTNSDCTYSNWTCGPEGTTMSGQNYNPLYCGPP